MSIVSILNAIEALRQEMYRAVAVYGIDSQQALTVSQRLDKALNQYAAARETADALKIA
ncbi:MAG: aspartyl-phosphate phosphatase Spo0E family protein [Sporomusaceae bacterium]|nr:aspartyl-phosphate phosphatase Spo0E family protein [Sporomusaceae bacterium]